MYNANPRIYANAANYELCEYLYYLALSYDFRRELLCLYINLLILISWPEVILKYFRPLFLFKRVIKFPYWLKQKCKFSLDSEILSFL